MRRGQWREDAMTRTATDGIADLGPLDRLREQKAWYWYDWANSAYDTTVAVGAVRAVPDLGRRATPRAASSTPTTKCSKTVERARARAGRRIAGVLRRQLRTIVSARWCCRLSVPRGPAPRKKWDMGGFALAGAIFAAGMFFVDGENWQLGAGRCSGPTACSAAARWSPTTRSWSTSRSRTSASTPPHEGGPSATSAAGSCSRINLACHLGHDASASARRWPVRVSRCRRRCGGRRSR